MYCYECGKKDCKTVYLTIPTIPKKPAVCIDCYKIREATQPDFGKVDPNHLRDA